MTVISADEHLVEPPEFWSDVLPASLPARDRDRAPRLDGPMLVVDGQVVPTFKMFPDLAGRSDTRPGASDPAGRLEVMDAESIDMALLFPQRAMGLFATADTPTFSTPASPPTTSGWLACAPTREAGSTVWRSSRRCGDPGPRPSTSTTSPGSASGW